MKKKSLDKSIKSASFDDIKVAGINTSLIDYKLAWNLNNKLSIDLVRYDDIVANDTEYSFYFYSAGDQGNTYNLVSLVRNNKVWIKTSPRIDYLLIIRNEMANTRFEAIINEICKINGVGHAFPYDLESDNNIHLVLETIEQHEIALLKRISDKNNLKIVREEMKQTPSNL